MAVYGVRRQSEAATALSIFTRDLMGPTLFKPEPKRRRRFALSAHSISPRPHNLSLSLPLRLPSLFTTHNSPLTLTLWLAISAAAWGVEIRWNTNQGPTTVEVTGVNDATLRELQGARWEAEHWQQVFAVYASG